MTTHRISGVFFLFLFFTTTPVSPFFLHSHTRPDGTVVIHSHISSRQTTDSSSESPPGSDHQHSNLSFLYQYLTAIGFDVQAPMVEPIPHILYSISFIEFISQVDHKVTVHSLYQWRGPPC